MKLLKVTELTHQFKTPHGVLQAVRGVNFGLDAGETLALVGESGSGKSTTARAVARLVQPTGGQVALDGIDILQADSSAMRALRCKVQMVFQDPYSSLDPLYTIERAVREPLDIWQVGGGVERSARVRELLAWVGLDSHYAKVYPSGLSGGQRQRVAIARALALNPRLVVCDEAVSALDVSVQAQVLNLLRDLQQRMGMAYLFITHDLAVVSEIADIVAVMFLGRIVEAGSRAQVLGRPAHPYTQALLSSSPRLNGGRQPIVLHGEAPSPLSPPSGCAFRQRCFRASTLCAQLDPQLLPIDVPQRSGQEPHKAACHHPEPWKTQ